MKRGQFASRLGGWSFVRLQRWLKGKSTEQAERIGERLGAWAYVLSKKHRRIADENLARAFPEKSPEERIALAKAVMAHFGRTMTDFMRSKGRTSEEALAAVELHGLENLREALSKGGVMIISAHYGNWERISQVLRIHHDKVSIIARDTNDPEMTALVNDLREGSGVGLISRGEAAYPTIKRLKNGEIVALLADQNSEDFMIPFFGVPAGTVLGPAILADRAGAKMLPCYCVRIGVGKFKMWIETPLTPAEGMEGPEAMMTSYNRSLEAAVRQYPDQYLWIHNRWKAAKRRGLA